MALDMIFCGTKENKVKFIFVHRYLCAFAVLIAVLFTVYVFGALILYTVA